MFELNFSKYSIIAPVTWRGRCEVFAESRYAMPVSKIGKSFRMVATSKVFIAISIGDLDIDLVALHGSRVGLGGNHGGQACHLAGDEVEARAVLRALHVHAPQLAVAEVELFVGADVVERVELAVLGVRETHRRGSSIDSLQAFDRHLANRSHPEPSQAAPPGPPR